MSSYYRHRSDHRGCRGRRGRLPGDRVRCGRPSREGPAHRPVDRRTDRARRQRGLAGAHRHRGRAFGNHLRLRAGRAPRRLLAHRAGLCDRAAGEGQLGGSGALRSDAVLARPRRPGEHRYQRAVRGEGRRTGHGKSLSGIAASGATVYGTWADGCTRGASGEAAVTAIDTATGIRKDVADLVLCPEEPRGIAVAPDGTWSSPRRPGSCASTRLTARAGRCPKAGCCATPASSP